MRRYRIPGDCLFPKESWSPKTRMNSVAMIPQGRLFSTNQSSAEMCRPRLLQLSSVSIGFHEEDRVARSERSAYYVKTCIDSAMSQTTYGRFSPRTRRTPSRVREEHLVEILPPANRLGNPSRDVISAETLRTKSFARSC